MAVDVGFLMGKWLLDRKSPTYAHLSKWNCRICPIEERLEVMVDAVRTQDRVLEALDRNASEESPCQLCCPFYAAHSSELQSFSV